MKYEDLSFEIVEDGVTLKCDVLEVIPNSNNSDEPYVVYTNYELDKNDEFIKKYGKLVSKNGHYYIETNLNSYDIDLISKMRNNEVVSYVNEIIENNIQ